MATQGIVSIVAGGKTVLKIVAGCNGMLARRLAEDLQPWCASRGVPSEAEAIEFAMCAGFGGDCPCLTVVTETKILNLVDGDVTNEPLFQRFRETFADPADNPRWEYKIADYVYFVDLTSGQVVKHNDPHTAI